MVSDDRMRRICLGNIDKLRSSEYKSDPSHFIKYLRISCSKAKTIGKGAAVDLCLLVLSCKGFDFNASNVKSTNNVAVECYWRAICTVYSTVAMFHKSGANEVHNLMMNRNVLGFQKFAKLTRVDSVT